MDASISAVLFTSFIVITVSDSVILEACDPVDGNGIFYSFGNPNSSCPFICEKARI